ncbi:MAG: SDR family oxidoreductase [Arachnia sp.]
MFQDKCAVVTGASSGIGRGLAQMLSSQGARVLAVGRDVPRLEAVRDCAAAVEILALDASAPGAADAIVDAAVARLGRLDIACVNAGIYVQGDIWDTSGAEIHDLVRTNAAAAMDLVRAAATVMRNQSEGDILVTSSVSGHQSIEWEPVYSGSKHAIQAFVHGVRRQLVGSGVRISSLAPGIVLNELWRKAAPDLADESQMQQLAEAGKGLLVSDVADAAQFMLSRPRNSTVRDLVLLPTNQDI